MNLTLRQYERADRAAYLTENPEVRAADYDRAYPPCCRFSEWLDELHSAARHHQPIAGRALDDLFRRDERSGWGLFRMIRPEDLPAGYRPPPTRARDREEHAKWVAARKRGREMAMESRP